MDRMQLCPSFKNGQIDLTMAHFELQTLQNVTKLIPDINIHLVGGLYIASWLPVSSHQRHLERTRALLDAIQAIETSHGERILKNSGW